MGRFFFLPAAYLLSLACWAQTCLIVPFANLTKSESLDWIGESFAEELTDALAEDGLLTIDRAARQEALARLNIRPEARLSRASIHKIGLELDAAYAVFGAYSGTPEALRVEMSILAIGRGAAAELRAGRQWTETIRTENLSVAQTGLAWRILETLQPSGRSLATYQQGRPVIRTEAIEAYVRGLGAATPEQRVRTWTEAARLDSGYGAPAFELGRAMLARKQWAEAVQWLTRVSPKSAHFREASFGLGVARFETGDYEAALAQFEKVLRDVPVSEVLNNIGVAQSRLKSPSAVETLRQALAGDEADPTYHFNLGYALLRQGEAAQAAERFRAVLDRNPNDSEAVAMLGRCLRPASNVPPGAERLKTSYPDRLFLELRAVVAPKTQPAKPVR